MHANTDTLVIKSARVVTPGGTRPAAVVIADGTITDVAGYDTRADVDLGELALLPGMVGAQADGADFAAMTDEAAAGGFTTVFDAPVTTVAALDARVEAARGRSHADVAFWGGAVPGNVKELRPLAEAGVSGFRASLCDCGLPPLDKAGLWAAMAEISGLGMPVCVHAEDPGELKAPHDGSPDSRPPVAERRAIETVISAAAATGARSHIAPLAAAECAALIGAAGAAGIALSAGTCPHYLFFAAEDSPGVPCRPPVRYAANREALWRALADGAVGCVGPGAITSPRVALPAVWTAGRARGFTLADVARWMSASPARLAGLQRKGAIAPGRDADLVAFDPDAPFSADNSLYAGRSLTGRVIRTWLRGTEVMRGAQRSPW